MPGMPLQGYGSGVAVARAVLPVEGTPEWYAVQTVARHEKRVASQLCGRGVESFLPLQVEVHRWGSRNASVELPLFAGYVFARFAYCDRLKVLTSCGVLRVVSFNGRPTAVSEAEIASLRGICGMANVQSCRYLKEGRRVRITHGALEGLEGVVVKRKSGLRFVISVEAIQQSIAVEISVADLECVA